MLEPMSKISKLNMATRTGPNIDNDDITTAISGVSYVSARFSHKYKLHTCQW
jgi:hypothetical protein